MDIGSLLSALTFADRAAKESNPFAPLQSASEGIGAALLQNAGQFSVKDNLIGGLLAGLASGLTGNLTDTYQDKQNSIAEDLLVRAMSGEGVPARPTELSPSVYSAVKNTGNLFTLESILENQAAQRQAQAQRENTIFGKYLENPEKTKYALESLTGAPAGGGGTPGIPGDQYQQALKKYRGDETLARSEVELSMKAPERVQALRDKFEALPEVKLFPIADSGFKAMQEAFNDPTGTSDVELTRRAIQAIEPGLAVRMDDQQAIENAPSLSQSYKAQMLGALTGESRLSPDVREGLMRIAARSYNQLADKFNMRRSFYINEAKKAGLDPTGITPFGEASKSELSQLGLSPGVAPPGMSASAADFEAMKTLAKSFPNTPEGLEQARQAWQMFQGK